jgi:hypothetical protein
MREFAIFVFKALSKAAVTVAQLLPGQGVVHDQIAPLQEELTSS